MIVTILAEFLSVKLAGGTSKGSGQYRNAVASGRR